MAVMMDADALNAFLVEVFQQVADDFNVEAVSADECTVRLIVANRHLRPGGTISGPAMFGLADVAAYIMTLARIGPKALAVTTNCSIDFMRKPRANTDLVAHCTLHKLGRVLAVGDVMLYSDGMEAPVARASLTYSIPPK